MISNSHLARNWRMETAGPKCAWFNDYFTFQETFDKSILSDGPNSRATITLSRLLDNYSFLRFAGAADSRLSRLVFCSDDSDNRRQGGKRKNILPVIERLRGPSLHAPPG